MAGVKAHTEYMTLTTKKRYEMVHLTPEVEAIVRRSKVVDGLCFVSPMHITAAIYVNDNEDGLIEDIGVWLEKLAPRWPGYKHHQTGEDNADAHLKALLLHHETTLPVTDGRLDTRASYHRVRPVPRPLPGTIRPPGKPCWWPSHLRP